MSRFFVSAAEALGLFVALSVALPLSVQMSIWLSLGIFLIALFVLITGRPVSRIRSRGKAAVIVGMAVYFLMASTTIYQNQREEYLATLRGTNADAYLKELSDMDETRWLSEMRKLRPDAYSDEMARRANEAKAERRRACTNKQLAMAYSMIQTDVRNRLKAPATADFPWRYAAGTQHEGDCVYRVVGYVDAQNGFGAMLRTNFEGRILYFPETESWLTVDVRMDE